MFDIIVNFIIQKLKNKHTFLKKPQKDAKLRQTKFSRFDGTRGDKNQIFRTYTLSHTRGKIMLTSILRTCPPGCLDLAAALNKIRAIILESFHTYLSLKPKVLTVYFCQALQSTALHIFNQSQCTSGWTALWLVERTESLGLKD